ncbi:MAG TPA: tyrosine-type recombinase/integrase [Alloacidobacterium sp.]|nr:tyrosine-type recombinase/integrase [Alloacidobacterium sp.]
MRAIPLQFELRGLDGVPFGPPKLLTALELSESFGVSLSWVYKHTKRQAKDPLPVVRLGGSVRFDPYKVAAYIRSRERHRASGTLSSSVGIARVSRKGKFTLTRRRFQTGSVRLRQDRGPAYWQGFYREDFINQAGRRVRKRRAINLGTLDETPNETVARQKLAAILQPINDSKHKPKKLMTFRGFIPLYRAYKMANQKGTTVHGYETNIRTHYLPAFGDFELSDISPADVQVFINEKRLEGKAVQTLRNLKWGLSSIFECAIKHGYVTSNPAGGADLPPDEVREQPVLPTGNQLSRLIGKLEEPYSTMVYLFSVSSIRPEELAFKWSDLNPETRDLMVVRAMNKGKFHTPKYHRVNRPIRLTEADVERLLALKAGKGAQDDDWMFPNRIKNGKKMKPGPMWHEHILARHIQPVADKLGLPHITWRLLRKWGATQMIAARVDIKAAQQRLGHSRPTTLLIHYAQVLDESADKAAGLLTGQLGKTIRSEFAVNPIDA